MATELADFPEWECPYCGKLLTDDEYNHALEEFRVKAEQEYKEQQRKDREYFEEQKQILMQKNQEEMEKLSKIHNEHSSKLVEKLKASYKDQIEDQKKSYDELARQRQNDFDKLLDQRLALYEEELYEKDRKLQELQNEQADFKAQAIEEAKVTVQADIDRERDKVREKDIQLKRAENEVDNIKKQLAQAQSELKGEVGELNLLDTLKNAFEQDFVERSQRGSAYGDVIQRIKMPSGVILETTIVYDNKKADTITPKDIGKAKGYMDSHATDHVIIVSKNLPKRDIKNGLYGEKDGVLLVHPCIIVEVAQQIRKAIIKISTLSASNLEQETKQSKMYDYIRSREFSKLIETICETHEALSNLQNDEEKKHRTLWQKRKALYEQLIKVHISISSGIDAIIQVEPKEEKDPIDVNSRDDMDGSHTISK